MFSSLTREQKQRREALREAKDLVKRNGVEPLPEEIMQVAMFILNDEVPAKDKSSHGGVSFE
jgi:hypothetical protein